MRRTRLAIFDIDGTIFRSSLIIELFNELVRRRVFPQRAAREVERDYRNWLNRKGHYNDYVMRVVRVFYREIAGCSVRRIAAAVRTTVARQKDHVYRFPRHLIASLRRRGFCIVAVSNSPEPMVRRFAASMGFDGAVGYPLETRGGVYTGRSILEGRTVPGASWMDKVASLREFIRLRRLTVDLRRSTMMGDSEGDVPLLSLVGSPIAFNPSQPLARIARRRGWRIIVERKDTVYDVRDARLIPVPEIKARIPYGRATR